MDREKVIKGLGIAALHLNSLAQKCDIYSALKEDAGCCIEALELLRKLQDIELYIKDCEREIDTGKNDTEKTYYKGVHYGLLIAKELINGIRSHG